jgi:glyoxylase-like metal-dependent hydrolase (beta-lactamase superfamily II)
VDHVWLTPAAALEAMGDRSIELWIPTSSTLVQREGVSSIDDVRERYGSPPIENVTVERSTVELIRRRVWRVAAHAAGGIPGRRAIGHLVGDRRFVLVDHGDPSEDAADAALRTVDDERGQLDAIVLTSSHPDNAGGAEALALRLGIPVYAAADARRRLPHDVEPLTDGARIPLGDRIMQVHVREIALTVEVEGTPLGT